MVGGVITGIGRGRRTAATNDAPGTAIARAGSLDRVFAVIAAGLWRELPLTIAEHAAVLGIGKGAALANQSFGLAGLGGQTGQRHFAITGVKLASQGRRERCCGK